MEDYKKCAFCAFLRMNFRCCKKKETIDPEGVCDDFLLTRCCGSCAYRIEEDGDYGGCRKLVNTRRHWNLICRQGFYRRKREKKK